MRSIAKVWMPVALAVLLTVAPANAEPVQLSGRVILVVLEGPAATHGDEPGVPDLGEDHPRRRSSSVDPSDWSGAACRSIGPSFRWTSIDASVSRVGNRPRAQRPARA